MKKFLLALFALISFSVHAERIVVYADSAYPPISYLKDGEPKGILVDIFKNAEKQTGDVYEFRLTTWGRALTESQSGKGCITDLSWNEERSKIYDYSKPIFIDTLNLVVIAGNEFQFKSVKDLKGKIIGKSNNSSMGDSIDKQMIEYQIEFDYDTSQLVRLKKLLAGKIDVAIIGTGQRGLVETIGDDEYLKKNMSRFFILPTPLTEDPLHFGCVKTMNKINAIERFNKAVGVVK